MGYLFDGKGPQAHYFGASSRFSNAVCVCVCVCVCVLFVLHLMPPRTGMHVHAESSETVGLEPAGRGPSVGYRRLGKQHQAPVQRGSARVCATLAMTACGTE